MRGKSQRLLIIVLGVILSFTSMALWKEEPVKAFSPQVIQRGATGEDVIELQARLQYIGFYRGKIDGVFGWGTYWALRNFQQKYGLPVDGLAGFATKNRLASVSQYNEAYVKSNLQKGNDFTYYGGIPLERQTSESYDHDGQKANVGNNAGGGAKAPAPNPGTANRGTPNTGKTGTAGNTARNRTAAPNNAANTSANYSVNNLPEGISQQDLKLLANAVYGESRGEQYIGQVAVAAVILNRVDSPKFPDTIAGVIFEPGAFTAVSDGQIWLTPNKTAEKAVMDALNGWDPTHGALYYFNPAKASSAWIWSRPQILKIGKHIFCK
ncbi:MAG: spore cortex-lytic enzyme [Tuberibacillus sp.]